MSYMNQNINFILLFLIVISIATLLGSTIYYQGVVGRLTQNYQDANSNINQLNKTVLLRTEELAIIESELLLKKKRETQLSTEYTSVKEEKETLATEKKDLTTQLESKKKVLIDTEFKLKQEKAQLASTKDKLEDTESDLKKKTNDYKKCRDDYDDCKNDLSSCKAGS